VLPEFHRRLAAVLAGVGLPAEIVYVDDGSDDGTAEALAVLRRGDSRVAVLSLSRNFGKEAALTAGLDYARGDAVVVIDADLQDPPELIPELLSHWKQGFAVVFAQRTRRLGEPAGRRVTAGLFYRMMRRVGRVGIPAEAGDFRLLSRQAVDAVRQMRERHRFMKGLFAWIGFPQKAVPYVRDPRRAGATKWTYGRLWNLALEGVTSFTIVPLRLATYIGLLAALAAFVYGVVIVVRTLVHGVDVPGYASLMTVVLFLGSLQLVALGVIGEYLGRTFDESKRRPLYFVREYLPALQREGPQARAPDTGPDAAPAGGNTAAPGPTSPAAPSG
jgi:glycosyltransferase involved in cell wall biosynthesis